jgi:hypothetical protein
MPDLSNLLGAVYGDGSSSTGREPEDEAHVEQEPAAAERGPAVPDWADDDHLDAAFAQWKPGPAPDASLAEHAFVTDADDDAPPPLADDLAAALSEALVAVSDSAEDTVDPVTGHEPPKRFDFSVQDEDDDPTEEAEPPQVFAPHDLSKSEIDGDERAETEQPHELGEVQEVVVANPESAAEPVLDDEAEAEPVLDDEPDAEPMSESMLEPGPMPEPALESTPEPEPAPWPSMTTQREAAAELTATSRVVTEPVVTEPVVAEPAPEPEPAPVTSAPVPVTPEPTRVPPAVASDLAVASDGGAAPTALPTGTRRWDRSDDDILPEKQAKKFFSFSLRRG